MSIIALPQFEEDLAEYQRQKAEEDKASRPESVVVRYGKMGHLAELSYRGEERLGCHHKLIIRSRRGTELADVLTTTCSNGGCGNSVTKEAIRDYIGKSGGHDFPFSEQGRVLRLATADDLLRQKEIESRVREFLNDARERARSLKLPMSVVDVEPILGGELLTIFFVADDRVDFRGLVSDLAAFHRTRIEMRQVGARDEARLLADYEKCGQHCCCKQFLKVLKPVSMKSAKVQKATLDPTKISGRCGRLMCCLRYEDQSYAELKKQLPHKKTRVGTPEGPGLVWDTQILTQLVLVRLESNGQTLAVPVEDLCDPEACPTPPPPPPVTAPEYGARGGGGSSGEGEGHSRKRRRGGRRRKRPEGGEAGQTSEAAAGEARPAGDSQQQVGDQPKKRRKRRRKRSGGGGGGEQAAGASGRPAESGGGGGELSGGPAPAGEGASAPKKRRRRRRKKRGGGGEGGGGGSNGGGDGGA